MSWQVLQILIVIVVLSVKGMDILLMIVQAEELSHLLKKVMVLMKPALKIQVTTIKKLCMLVNESLSFFEGQDVLKKLDSRTESFSPRGIDTGLLRELSCLKINNEVESEYLES